MLLTPQISLQSVLGTMQSVQPQGFKCDSGQFSMLFVLSAFLQYSGNKTLNFGRHDLSCNFQISLKVTEAWGQGKFFCFAQFPVMMLSSEALLNFCLHLCVNCYWHLQESVPFQSRLFEQVESYSEVCSQQNPWRFLLYIQEILEK